MENNNQKRLLMALMSFDIGGAETHVLELSLELKRMGYYVVVASNGGVYEKNLKEAGIPHYKVPMHSKHPSAVFESLKLLKNIIKDEKIDLVHAHGRIPAFLCGILEKTMKFTFVTTAHWVFDTSHGLKYITNWGKKVVAVSEDIKKYLIDNYETNPTDIYVTINGIDTEKFSKDADASSIMEEFSLEQNTKKIVYISRMDSDRALVAFHLVKITPELVKINPDIEIVIVGGGNVFDKLKEEVDTVNKKLGKRYIVLTGSRTDIYKFCSLSDVFIGVSRSALEAMACEKPVIVAGNEGYLGIFDEDKIENAINTNFCCRGLAESTPELLLRDMTTLLSNAPRENERLGSYGRNVILNNYSLKRMASDCVKMYEAAWDNKKWDAVLMGYYGFNNSGDETLLYSMIKNLREEKDDIRLLVLSKIPKETAEKYGVYSINRYNILKIKKELKNSHLFIFGGGSLIQDVTSDKSLWYYLSMLKLAFSAKIPVMLYANGIGPVNKEKNRKKAAEILNKVNLITLRDENSFDEVKSMGVGVEYIITADPALSMTGIEKEEAHKLLKLEGIEHNEKLVAVSIRDWKNCDDSFWDKFTAELDDVCEKHGLTPLFIPMKNPEDKEISVKISRKLKKKSYILEGLYKPEEIIGIFATCSLTIGMRLHSLIYSQTAGVPSIGISYDPKVRGFTEYAGIDTVVELDAIEKISKFSDEIFKNYDDVKIKISKNLGEIKQKTKKTAELALELIKNDKE